MTGQIMQMDTPISIHAPREGSDTVSLMVAASVWAFQSTLPVKGATLPFSMLICIPLISIHAPREGSDAGQLLWESDMGNFNPRSP